MSHAASARTHVEDLADYVAAAPSSYHAAEEVARRLEEQGFTRLDETEAWPAQAGGRFVIVRDGAAIAWVVPAGATATSPSPTAGSCSPRRGRCCGCRSWRSTSTGA